MDLRLAAVTGGRILRVRGTLDSSTVPNVERTLASLLDDDRATVTVDLSEAEYVSSAAWSLFVTWRQRALRAGGDLILRGVHSVQRDMLAHLKAEPLLRLE